MKCIYCASGPTEVINSRETGEGTTVWRRRSCSACGRVYTTRESARGDNAFIIKRSGRRQRFVYEKLFVSIFSVIDSQKHRDNGDNALLAKRIAEAVQDDMLWALSPEGNVSSADVIAMVARRLRETRRAYADRYVHYSPYREQVMRGSATLTP